MNEKLTNKNRELCGMKKDFSFEKSIFLELSPMDT